MIIQIEAKKLPVGWTTPSVRLIYDKKGEEQHAVFELTNLLKLTIEGLPDAAPFIPRVFLSEYTKEGDEKGVDS